MKKGAFIIYLLFIILWFVWLQYVSWFFIYNDIFPISNTLIYLFLMIIYFFIIFIVLFKFYKNNFFKENIWFVKISITLIWILFFIWLSIFTKNTIPYIADNDYIVPTNLNEFQTEVLNNFTGNWYNFWVKNYNIFNNINEESQLRNSFIILNIESIEDFLNYKIPLSSKIISREWIYLQKLQNNLRMYHKKFQ